MSNREVIGNLLGTTTPTEVAICVDPSIVRTSPLRLREYLVIDYQCEDLEKPVLASVSEIGLENQNMPNSILTSPREFQALTRIGDLRDGEVLKAKARILGFLNEASELEMPRFSPPPGAEVFRAPQELLEEAFGQGHIEIGHLLTNEDVRVRLNVDELIRRHLAVLAITGGGKGNTVAVIISRILEMGGAVVVIDPHSEYIGMRNELGDRLVAFSVEADPDRKILPLRFRFNSFSADDFLSILRVRSNANRQRELFRDAYELLEDTEWDYEDLENTLEQADGGEDSEQLKGLKSLMNEATEIAILDKSQEVPLAGGDGPGIVNEGCMTVLSLSGLDTDVQQAVVRRVSQKILRGAVAWRLNHENEES
ncbi:MAG: DUF87 domain-containing protein, partial [Candidatus Lokiarchaeota archaeon]|nr:DUF87 domain-containing protein [Candidatus Lokiarchaeota archaeon]